MGSMNNTSVKYSNQDTLAPRNGETLTSMVEAQATDSESESIKSGKSP